MCVLAVRDGAVLRYKYIMTEYIRTSQTNEFELVKKAASASAVSCYLGCNTGSAEFCSSECTEGTSQ